MSAFSDAEIEYLGSQRLGRLARVGQDGMPHVVPVAFRYNPDADSIDVGGHDFAKRKKVPRRPADGQIRAAPAGERSHGRRTARARIMTSAPGRPGRLGSILGWPVPQPPSI